MNRILVLFITFCLSVLSYGQNAVTLRKARAGNADAQYSMAKTYKYGLDGAEKNCDKHVYWLKKAAINGHVKAQYYLGDLYKTGESGVSKDDTEYLHWTKKAAYNGYEAACFSLGLHYMEIDKQEAIYWFKKDMDISWKNNKKESKFSAGRLRELGVYYHPGDKSTYSTSSNIKYIDNQLVTAIVR